MGGKYEVLYWDYNTGREVPVGHYRWLAQALWVVHKLTYKWPHVVISVRSERSFKNGNYQPKRISECKR